MSEDSFIILDEDVNSKRYKQFLSDKKRYKALMLTFLENTKLNNRYTRLTALELKNKTLEYYTLLSESDKQIFSTYYDNFLMQYIAKFTAPIENDFEVKLSKNCSFLNLEILFFFSSSRGTIRCFSKNFLSSDVENASNLICCLSSLVSNKLCLLLVFKVCFNCLLNSLHLSKYLEQLHLLRLSPVTLQL